MTSMLQIGLSDISKFLAVSESTLHGITNVIEANFLSGVGKTPEEILPEKGPFIFFKGQPVVIVTADADETFILGTMKVLPEFCKGHFDINSKFEARMALPLYFIGGAAGQLCAMYTTIITNDDRYVALATSGSASSLAKDLIDVGSTLLFVITVSACNKHGFEFTYNTFHNDMKVASGEVSSIAVPKIAMFKRSTK